MATSIINSDDGVVSGTSGLKTTGGDTGGLNFQSNGTNVFDYTATQVVARQTFYAIDGGIPIIARSTDSNAYKFAMQDTSGGTQRGYLGANSTNALMVADGSVTNVMNVTSAGLLQFNSGYGAVATAYGCRAWVNFDGTNTPAIRASGNVGSITDNGTGDYTLNFSASIIDANYSAVSTINQTSNGGWYVTSNLISLTTSSIRIACVATDTGNTNPADPTILCVAVFR